jgi:hypothetical protein
MQFFVCAGYFVRPDFWGKTNGRKSIMVFYPHLIITWEQRNKQISSLASRVHQTLAGKAGSS